MLFYSLIPVLLMFIVIVIVQSYQSSSLREKTIARQAEEFRTNLVRIETSIGQIADSIELLGVDNNIREIMMMSSTDYQEKVSKNFAVEDTLQRCKNIYDIISNIAVVNRNNRFVIDTMRRTSFEEYYSVRRQYKGYDVDFWENLKIQSSGYDILSPVAVEHDGVTENVFPMIIGSMRDVKNENFIVVDLKCDIILEMLENGSFEEKNIFFIMDEHDKKTILFGEDNFDTILNDSELNRNLNDKQNFDYVFNQKKYLVISHKDNISFMNKFRYVIMVPHEELLAEFNAGVRLIYWLIFVFILIVICLCYYFSKRLYSPVAAMMNELRQKHIEGTGIKDEFEFIFKSLDRMIEDNLALKDDIKKKLTLLNEQALLKELNSTGYINDKEISDLLMQNGFIFSEKYFIAAYITIKFTEEFYNLFNQDQYMQIIDGIYSVFDMQFNDKRKSILMAQSNEDFVVLFNVGENEMDDVIGILNSSSEIFETDRSLIKLCIGIGNMYEGYVGMHNSYLEAVRAQSVLASMSGKNILIYHKADDNMVGYKYSIDKENILLNYIIKGDFENAVIMINNIAEENYNYTGDYGIKKLYNQILQTVLRAVIVKNIDLRILMGENYLSPDRAYVELNNGEFIEYVNKLAEQVTVYTDVKNTQKDISGLIEYIDKHYAEEIYLENMAEMLNTSAKYLSRLVKNQLGINFTQYVAKVRIEKAKELLVTTNKNINEIMALTGFTMRNTFIRTFRKFEGVTPSEYRKFISEKNKYKGDE